MGRPSQTPLKVTGANSAEDDSNSSSPKNDDRIIEEADPEEVARDHKHSGGYVDAGAECCCRISDTTVSRAKEWYSDTKGRLKRGASSD